MERRVAIVGGPLDGDTVTVGMPLPLLGLFLGWDDAGEVETVPHHYVLFVGGPDCIIYLWSGRISAPVPILQGP